MTFDEMMRQHMQQQAEDRLRYTFYQRDAKVPTIDDRPKRCYACGELAPTHEDIVKNPELDMALLCPSCGPVHMECHINNVNHLIHCYQMSWSQPLYVVGEGKQFRFILNPG